MQIDFPLTTPGQYLAVKQRAFTLIELLVVMSIVVVLLTLIAPATNNILRGSDLTQTNQILTNLLGLARQQALTQNRPVEVRFYQFADTGESPADSTTWKYRAVQTFTISEAGVATPIGKMNRFPNTIIIDKGTTLSSMIGNAQASASTSGAVTAPTLTNAPQTYSIPVLGTNYNAVAFRFYADGSTNFPLPSSTAANLWFLTLHQVQAGDGMAQAPSNFASIQIDPANGNLREFRP